MFHLATSDSAGASGGDELSEDEMAMVGYMDGPCYMRKLVRMPVHGSRAVPRAASRRGEARRSRAIRHACARAAIAHTAMRRKRADVCACTCAQGVSTKQPPFKGVYAVAAGGTLAFYRSASEYHGGRSARDTISLSDMRATWHDDLSAEANATALLLPKKSAAYTRSAAHGSTSSEMSMASSETSDASLPELLPPVSSSAGYVLQVHQGLPTVMRICACAHALPHPGTGGTARTPHPASHA